MTEQISTEAESARQEFDSLQKIFNALLPLAESARERVVKHVTGMLKMSPAAKGEQATELEQEADEERTRITVAPTVQNFAELFNAIDPQTAADKALVAGYWLQVCSGAESFDGQSANKELNHLGHRVTNITNALTALNSLRPALAIQLKKSGTSRQARKTYKVTTAGEEFIREKLNG